MRVARRRVAHHVGAQRAALLKAAPGRVAPQRSGIASPADVYELRARTTSTPQVRAAAPAAAGKDSSPLHRVAGNLRSLVAGLHERQARLVRQTVTTVRALGLTAARAGTVNDLRQLYDFAKLALAEGRPGSVIAPIVEVLEYVLRYPDEASRILRFLERVSPDTWTQKSAWMVARAAPLELSREDEAPVLNADVVIIGGGLSAASMVRHFAQHNLTAARPLRVCVLEKDHEDKRKHAASLRNGGMVCTAMDYVFGLDDAVGAKPVERIKTALAVSQAEAEKVYEALMKVLVASTQRVEQFLAERGVDIAFHKEGSIEVATSPDELAVFRAAVKQARAMGFDWEVVDRQWLVDSAGIDGRSIEGGVLFRDWSVLDPGKYVRALFDYATEHSGDITIQWETEFRDAKPAPGGDGWRLRTSRGTIHAAHVVDAREGFAPYSWREARYSQIHVIDASQTQGPKQLSYTGLNHALSYMRSLGGGKFLVGSGDFPVSTRGSPPAPLASIALYAAACFKKMYPDAPFEMERVWGGVFGLSKDGLPVAGELAGRWYVLGGAGGTGLSFCPALGEQTVRQIVGRDQGLPVEAVGHTGPRRFFELELRRALASGLQELPGQRRLRLEDVRVEVVDPADASATQASSVRKVGRTWVARVPVSELDAMNPDLLAILGGEEATVRREREGLREAWLAARLAEARAMASA